MADILNVLLQIAGILILALTICFIVAIPFIAYKGYQRFKRMDAERAAFASEVKQRQQDIRSRMRA